MSTTAGKALAFSVGGFKSKATTAQALKDRIPAISPAGGLLFTLADPVGMAADLGALMQKNFDSFKDAKVRKRELAIQQGEAYRKAQHFGVAAAFYTSAVVGVGAAAALLVGATAVGLILVVLLIAVAVVLEYIKDNKIQSWLERCLWGKGSSTRYQNADEEMSELRIATTG